MKLMFLIENNKKEILYINFEKYLLPLLEVDTENSIAAVIWDFCINNNLILESFNIITKIEDVDLYHIKIKEDFSYKVFNTINVDDFFFYLMRKTFESVKETIDSINDGIDKQRVYMEPLKKEELLNLSIVDNISFRLQLLKVIFKMDIFQ